EDVVEVALGSPEQPQRYVENPLPRADEAAAPGRIEERCGKDLQIGSGDEERLVDRRQRVGRAVGRQDGARVGKVERRLDAQALVDRGEQPLENARGEA